MTTKVMYIKIVHRTNPDGEGRWITVPLRSEAYRKFPETVELYTPDIPTGWEAVSFTRFPDMMERLK